MYVLAAMLCWARTRPLPHFLFGNMMSIQVHKLVQNGIVKQHSGIYAKDTGRYNIDTAPWFGLQGLGGDYSGLFDGEGDEEEAWVHNPVGAYGRNMSLELQITGLSASDTSKDLEQLLSAADLIEDVLP